MFFQIIIFQLVHNLYEILQFQDLRTNNANILKILFFRKKISDEINVSLKIIIHMYTNSPRARGHLIAKIEHSSGVYHESMAWAFRKCQRG